MVKVRSQTTTPVVDTVADEPSTTRRISNRIPIVDGWSIYSDAHNVVLVSPTGRSTFYPSLAQALRGWVRLSSSDLPDSWAALVAKIDTFDRWVTEIATTFEGHFSQ